MKHMYDKKPAEEFDCILQNIISIIKFPEEIYRNKTGKQGDFIFKKEIKGLLYLCSIQIIESDINCGNLESNYIVTAFRLRPKKTSYLNSYGLLWSWKGDLPSS